MVRILQAGDGVPSPAADAAVDEAADRLARGELVAFPTETVYGLGARADDAAAVGAIYAAKGRPNAHPLIVHVADAAAAEPFAASWPPLARRLAQAFWPGALTVIVPRRDGLAAEAAGGQASIGLRCPSHPVAQALLRAAAGRGVPGVAAPSANRFGQVSPTRAEHVATEFQGLADLLVLDAGPCELGIESTIIDCTREQPVLLRPGTLERHRLEAAAGQPLRERDAQAPRASGTLAAHYAPRARLRLMPAGMLQAALDVLGPPPAGKTGAAAAPVPAVAVYSRTVRVPPAMVWRRMPQDAAAAAHELFFALRELDASGAQIIWVEQPPDHSGWDGVRDRLQRAAAA
jgi:L-threonylcarbamoyladenylate synthase